MDYMRPTTSKVRLAITSMLSRELIEKSKILDIFAGIGSVSEEFDKFGPKKIVMIEKNIKNIKVLEKKFKNKHEIIKGNVYSLIPKLNEKFNIIFADPPYEHREFPKITDSISESKIIAEDGLFIYEHYKDYELPNQYADFKKVRDKKYGDTRLSIYKLEGEADD